MLQTTTATLLPVINIIEATPNPSIDFTSQLTIETPIQVKREVRIRLPKPVIHSSHKHGKMFGYN
jgi:hypothetical protein